jgi:hypothetical protein
VNQALSNIGRALCRPWPWALRYGLTTVPAGFLALVFALPLRSWFRVPLLVEALEARSLEKLGEFALHAPSDTVPIGWLVTAFLSVPVIWAVVQLLGLWFEGGILATYAHPAPPSWRAFAAISTRALGRFALLALIGISLTLLLVAATLVVALVGRAFWPPLVAGAVYLGMGAIGCLWVWIRLARASVVAREEGHVLKALREAWRTVRRWPLPVVALAVSVFALRRAFRCVGGCLLSSSSRSRSS